MKKLILVAAVLITVLCCLCACGETQNAVITSPWKAEEITVKGDTMHFGSLTTDKKAPAFSCTDGKSFTFTLNEKEHTGTLVENNGVYTLSFDDTYKTMEARISDNKLILTVKDSDDIEIVFKAK